MVLDEAKHLAVDDNDQIEFSCRNTTAANATKLFGMTILKVDHDDVMNTLNSPVTVCVTVLVFL
jgi:hypothetical protein